MGSVEPHKTERVRSPAYPAFDLKTAIQKVKTIYDHEKRTFAPVAVVAKHCGLDIKSSGALRLIAALKQFGLFAEQGGGDDRKVRVSDRALDILLAETDGSAERIAAIKAAALSPKIHKLLWEHYKGELPSDATIKAHLVRTLEFNDAQVDKFIKEFRSTIDFAELGESDKIAPADERKGRSEAERSEQVEAAPRQHGRRPMEPGTKEATLPLDVGQIIVQWPERISSDEVKDVEGWMELVVRRMKRAAQEKDEEPEGE